MKTNQTLKARPRRGLMLAAVAGAVLAGFGTAAIAQSAQNFPSKPVRIVVPAAPGGASDILARMIGQKLTEKWNQPVIVENKPGADSNLGADYVAKSPADGYTTLLLDVGTLTMGPHLFPKLGYNPATDLAPVTMIVFSPFVFTANAGLPANNMKELLAYGKANPDKLNFASVTSTTRLAAARLKLEAGLDMLVVPYKSGGAALTAITGGEANLTMASLLSTYPHIKGGRIKAIGMASMQRMEAAAEIPTISESGVPNYVAGSWQGLLAPAATPPDVVRKINAAVVEILHSPDIKGKLVSQGAEVIANTPEDFGKFLRAETERWGKVVKDANIKVE
jgi:tripartite-type tricarboxylate transporter receptor subunit TctC